MVEDTDRKSKKTEPASAESGSGANQSRGQAVSNEKAESHLLPFAKPYNQYFDAVREAHRSLHETAVATHNSYVKDAQEAVKARDAEALRSATDKFYTAWNELAKPFHIASSTNDAFEAYRRELTSAVASGALSPLGSGCLAMVAQSIAVVASHHMYMYYQRSFSGL